MSEPLGPCTKRPFESMKAALTHLRYWQKKSRRSAFDSAHPYKADCREHKGSYHVGHNHGAHDQGEEHPRRAQLNDDLDDLFLSQHVRVLEKINRISAQMISRRKLEMDPDGGEAAYEMRK